MLSPFYNKLTNFKQKELDIAAKTKDPARFFEMWKKDFSANSQEIKS